MAKIQGFNDVQVISGKNRDWLILPATNFGSIRLRKLLKIVKSVYYDYSVSTSNGKPSAIYCKRFKA